MHPNDRLYGPWDRGEPWVRKFRKLSIRENLDLEGHNNFAFLTLNNNKNNNNNNVFIDIDKDTYQYIHTYN